MMNSKSMIFFLAMFPLFAACGQNSSSQLASDQNPFCSSAAVDPDGDGWGWEYDKSCRVEVACASSVSDPDGDGWGWENEQSCRVNPSPAGKNANSQDTQSLPSNSYELELAALRNFNRAATPSLEAIQAAVTRGFPKPEDDKARAQVAHALLMSWGHSAIASAFLLHTENVAEQARLGRELREHLQQFVSFGSNFGDVADKANYGNLPLELIWFMGNMARAADILKQRSADVQSGVQGLWTAADQQAFAQWAQNLSSRYFELGVYPAGLSNRKASQIETLMRIDNLAGNQTRLASRMQSMKDLLVAGIDDRGVIPEDSARDKYHPQFFMAAALQAVELGQNKGLRLSTVVNGQLAISRLAAALNYAAESNLSSAAPAEFPAMQNPAPNYEIPFWYLAPRFLTDHGQNLPKSVEIMVQENYRSANRFDWTMNWGFNAIATRFKL
jgi:hypothetical protein